MGDQDCPWWRFDWLNSLSHLCDSEDINLPPSYAAADPRMPWAMMSKKESFAEGAGGVKIRWPFREEIGPWWDWMGKTGLPVSTNSCFRSKTWTKEDKRIGYFFCLDSIPWTTSPVSVVQFDRVHSKIFHRDVEWHLFRMISPFEKKSTDVLWDSHLPNTGKKTPVKLQAFPAVVATSILGRRNCNWKMICTTW